LNYISIIAGLALISMEQVEGARELVAGTSVSDILPGTHRLSNFQNVGGAAADAALAFDASDFGF